MKIWNGMLALLLGEKTSPHQSCKKVRNLGTQFLTSWWRVCYQRGLTRLVFYDPYLYLQDVTPNAPSEKIEYLNLSLHCVFLMFFVRGEYVQMSPLCYTEIYAKEPFQ